MRMESQSTLGPLLPHTEAKHDILRYHLEAWFPILGHSSNHLQYIDGFSGPGEYEGGEPGSPIIVLDAVLRHAHFEEFASGENRFDFLFVDENPNFIDHLNNKLNARRWPSTFNIEVQCNEFEVALGRLLDDVDSGRRVMPPTLAFIDPFGPSGFSLDLLARLAGHKRVDVLINLNHAEFVRGILSDPTKHVTADRLYGSSRWKPALSMDGKERDDFLVSEYESALGEIGWRGTNFEMVNTNNQTQYYLVFGTGDPKGMEVMKRAMRRVSPDGLFRYSDRSDPNQLRLMGTNAALDYPREIADSLFQKYDGQDVLKKDIVDENIAWHPRWLETDLTEALKLLEESTPSRISNVRFPDGRSRRRGSYPDGCIITFGASGQARWSF